jgi:hypothetical protein
LPLQEEEEEEDKEEAKEKQTLRNQEFEVVRIEYLEVHEVQSSFHELHHRNLSGV